MATADATAAAHYQQRAVLTVKAGQVAQRYWRQINPSAISPSWQALSASLLRLLTISQHTAASAADSYVAAILRTAGTVPAPVARVSPAAFAGIASDGRDLGDLLTTPLIDVYRDLGDGMPTSTALLRGMNRLVPIVATQVQDAGRLADQTAMATHVQIDGYVRHVNLPACARCIILAGRHYRYSTGFERHPKCLPAGAVVSGPARLATTRRWYEGELVVISTASGQELAITGNHPVLTDRGWLPANLITEGDHVVRSVRTEGARSLVIPDEHQMPSLIQDLWRPDGVVPLGQVPTTAEDFHGDGMRGHVDVVLADRFLRNGLDAALSEPCAELAFAFGVESAAKLAAEGTLLQLLDGALGAADGFMGCGSLPGALFGGHPGRTVEGGIRTAAPDDARLVQPSLDSGPGDAEPHGDGVLTFAGEVGVDDLGIGHRDAPAPRWDAPGSYLATEDRAGYASRGRDLLERLAGQVELDRVVELRRVSWSGHVYNLTSAEGWFAANNLIVSNCDCVMIPDVESIAPQDPAQLIAQVRRDYPDGPHAITKSLTDGDLKAIDHGADVNQVINAHRGMATAAGRTAGQRVPVTREGTTRRGLAGQRLRGKPRMTPALIFDEASRGGWSREQILAQLMRAGFII